MKILSIQSTPFAQLPYQNALGKGRVEQTRLPLLRATVDRLPLGVDAIVATSDLQGREPAAGQPSPRLLGQALPELLLELAEAGELPPPERTGVILAGDLYTVPGLTKRGGLGDVTPVWDAFTGPFRWVAGVAGNHDAFGGGPRSLERYRRRGAGHLLDGDVVRLDALSLAGVSGVIGRPSKANRRREGEFIELLAGLLARRPDVVVLHQGPDVPGLRLRGHEGVRDALSLSDARLLVICGHCHWPTPLAELGGGVQVLNVDARAVILEAT
jgi:hypothetical protein